MHNDFRCERGIFPLFEGLEVPDIDKTMDVPSDAVKTNGVHHDEAKSDATFETNGGKAEPAVAADATHETGAGPSVQP